MNEPQLFNPRETEPARCPKCGTSRKNLCEYSADLRAGSTPGELGQRPKHCLDRYDPATAPFPENY